MRMRLRWGTCSIPMGTPACCFAGPIDAKCRASCCRAANTDSRSPPGKKARRCGGLKVQGGGAPTIKRHYLSLRFGCYRQDRITTGFQASRVCCCAVATMRWRGMRRRFRTSTMRFQRFLPSDRVRDHLETFMNFSSIFARIVALIGAVALLWRRLQGSAPAPAWGNAPAIPEAKPQGAIPTLKMPSAQGWSDGQKPTAAPGLKVNAFAKDLDHPRWINVLPNGDVLIAEATQIAGPPRSVFHHPMQSPRRR